MRSNRYVVTLGFVLSAILISGCGVVIDIGIRSKNRVQGSGNVVIEDRFVRDFDRVTLMGSGSVEITQGAEEALTVETDDNIMRYIETEVKNGTLILGYTDEAREKNLRPSREIVFSLSLKDLTEVEIIGSGSVTSDRIESDKFVVRITGSGDVTLDELLASSAEVKILGSGAVELVGEVQAQKVVISGSGNYDAADLSSERADISIPGSGSAVVWAVEFLEVSIPGSGEVRYYGDPEVDINVGGSGSVSRRGDR